MLARKASWTMILQTGLQWFWLANYLERILMNSLYWNNESESTANYSNYR